MCDRLRAPLPFQIHFSLLSLELNFSWAYGHLSGDCISHSALWLDAAVWLFRLWSISRCNVYIFHITWLKESCLPYTAFSLSLPPGHRQGGDPASSAQSHQTHKAEGNWVPESLHKELPSQPWLPQDVFKLEGKKHLPWVSQWSFKSFKKKSAYPVPYWYNM